VPQRLERYLEQAAIALQEAERAGSQHDRDTWLRIAGEWQSLHAALARDLGSASGPTK